MSLPHRLPTRSPAPVFSMPAMARPGLLRDAADSRGDDGAPDLGKLPEWDLTDLYPAPDAPEMKRDLDWLEEACASFAADYEGKLARLDSDGHAGLRAAVRKHRHGGGADHVLRRPALLAEHVDAGTGQADVGPAGQDHRFHRAAGVLQPGAEPDSRRRAGQAAAGKRRPGPVPADLRPAAGDEPLPAVGRAREVPARPVRRRRQRLEQAVRRDHGGAGIRRRGRDAEPGGHAVAADRPAAPGARGGGAGAGEGVRGEPDAVLAHHQHAGQGKGSHRPLAGDADAADRPPPGQPRSSPRWSRRCATRW